MIEAFDFEVESWSDILGNESRDKHLKQQDIARLPRAQLNRQQTRLRRSFRPETPRRRWLLGIVSLEIQHVTILKCSRSTSVAHARLFSLEGGPENWLYLW